MATASQPGATGSRRPCNCGSGAPVERMHLERALDALRIGGRQAGRGHRIHARELRVQRRPALARRARIERRAHRGIRLRQGRQALGERLEVEHRAAREDRHAAALADRLHRGDAHRGRSAQPNTIRWDRRCRSGDAARARARPRTASPCRCPCRDRPARSPRTRSRRRAPPRAPARARSCPTPWDP